MKCVLILANIIAALLVFPAMELVHRAYVVRSESVYIELNRHEIIDQVKLKQMFPDQQGDNGLAIVEYLFGPFYRVKYLAYPCMAAFFLNAFLLAIYKSGHKSYGDAKEPVLQRTLTDE